MKTWKQKLQSDLSYDIKNGYKRKRRAIFTIEEENAIADYIRTNIIETGQFFTDNDFRTIAITAFLEKYQDCEKILSFNCSNGFIYDFKKTANYGR